MLPTEPGISLDILILLFVDFFMPSLSQLKEQILFLSFRPPLPFKIFCVRFATTNFTMYFKYLILITSIFIKIYTFLHYATWLHTVCGNSFTPHPHYPPGRVVTFLLFLLPLHRDIFVHSASTSGRGAGDARTMARLGFTRIYVPFGDRVHDIA